MIKSPQQIFVNDLKILCEQSNVELILSKTDSIMYLDSIECCGYFDNVDKKTKSPILVCSIGKNLKNIKNIQENFLSTLVHESCHMDQWLENDKIWENNLSCDIVDSWLSGNEIENIKFHIERTRELELDCEKRTVEKIKKYNLRIDVNSYIQKANAYVQFYNYILNTRKWSTPENSPYNDIITLNLPDVFKEKTWYETLPCYIEELFIKNKVCL